MNTNVYTTLHIKMSQNEQKAPVSARVPLELFADLYTELKYTGQNRSQFIQEAIEEKLLNCNKELIEAEVKYLEKKIKILKKRAEQIKTKKQKIKEQSKEEINFLKESREILGKNPNFIKGRIKLYKNLFNAYELRITEQDFWEMLDKVE